MFVRVYTMCVYLTSQGRDQTWRACMWVAEQVQCSRPPLVQCRPPPPGPHSSRSPVPLLVCTAPRALASLCVGGTTVTTGCMLTLPSCRATHPPQQPHSPPPSKDPGSPRPPIPTPSAPRPTPAPPPRPAAPSFHTHPPVQQHERQALASEHVTQAREQGPARGPLLHGGRGDGLCPRQHEKAPLSRTRR